MNTLHTQEAVEVVSHMIADVELNNYSVEDVIDIEWVLDYAMSELEVTAHKQEYKCLLMEHFNIIQ